MMLTWVVQYCQLLPQPTKITTDPWMHGGIINVHHHQGQGGGALFCSPWNQNLKAVRFIIGRRLQGCSADIDRKFEKLSLVGLRGDEGVWV